MRSVFITGASSGIGAGLARHYAAGGAHIGLVARRTALLETLAEEIKARGATPHLFAGDVVDTAFMAEAARRFSADAGAVDLVIANAGIGIRDRTREGDASEIAKLMQVNVVGVTNTIVPFVPVMLAQKRGVLSAVSSVAGHRAMPGRGAYCASKAAVIVFMDALRMDLVGTGVHAMTFCPGFVKTPLTEGNKGMRFVIGVEEAVETMANAVIAHRDTITFPWQMRLVSEVMKRAPESVVRRMSPPARSRSSS